LVFTPSIRGCFATVAEYATGFVMVTT